MIQNPDDLILDKKRIPDYIWDHRTKCQDYQNCVTQTGTAFGFVPLTPLKLYQGRTVHWNTVPDILQAHTIIAATGLPNFMAARIPIQSQLTISNWMYLFICCFTSRSTARVILRRVVYRWRKPVHSAL